MFDEISYNLYEIRYQSESELIRMLRETLPYFVFDGHAAEAIEFYADVLDGEVLSITYFRDLPEDPGFPLTEEMKNLVLNATLELPNGRYFMFSDNMPEMPFTVGNHISITLTFDDMEETRRVFDRLKEGGNVEMELQETFWSPLYGNVTDRFGNQWQIDTDLQGDFFEELKK